MTKPKINKEAQADFDLLINAYLDGAKKNLETDKFLVPIALILNTKDEPEFVSMLPETEGDFMSTDEHLKLYRRLLREHDQNTKACLLGYEITLNYPGYKDAITMELEHRNGTLQQVFVPYVFTGLLKKKLKLGQMMFTDDPQEHILRHL